MAMLRVPHVDQAADGDAKQETQGDTAHKNASDHA